MWIKCDLTICRFQNQLPQDINKRPEQFLTQEELIKLMDWKLTVSCCSFAIPQELKDWLGYKIVHGFVMSNNKTVFYYHMNVYIIVHMLIHVQYLMQTNFIGSHQIFLNNSDNLKAADLMFKMYPKEKKTSK